MIQVINGEIINTALPQTGYVNGNTVSRYDLLPEEVLMEQGWLPEETDIPEHSMYDEVVFDTYEILANKVIKHYKIAGNLNIFTNEKEKKIDESNIQLEEYLKNHPLLFTDGNYYSVTKDKQNLLAGQLLTYQLELQAGNTSPELTWNATGEICVVWDYENLVSLTLAIKEYVKPLVKAQQQYEKNIKSCTTFDELNQIIIDYNNIIL
jgi:hypothetical protein